MMALSPWLSCLYLSSPGVIGVCQHRQVFSPILKNGVYSHVQRVRSIVRRHGDHQNVAAHAAFPVSEPASHWWSVPLRTACSGPLTAYVSDWVTFVAQANQVTLQFWKESQSACRLLPQNSENWLVRWGVCETAHFLWWPLWRLGMCWSYLGPCRQCSVEALSYSTASSVKYGPARAVQADSSCMACLLVQVWS